MQAGTVVQGQDIEKFDQEVVVLLSPDGVDNVQPETFAVLTLGALSAAFEFLIKIIECEAFDYACARL